MKANETPEKIYLYPYSTDGIYEVETKPLEGTIEYTNTNVFIEKACDWLKKEVVEDYKGVLWENLIEDFKNYMKEE